MPDARAFHCAFASPVPVLHASPTPLLSGRISLLSPRQPARRTMVTASASCKPAHLIAVAAASALISFNLASPAAATISAEQCISGEGPGCAAAAAESPIIKELLEKSKANRAKHEKEMRDDYWARGYGDYFSFGYNKVLVQGDDGKWSLQEPNDLRSQVERKIIDAIRGKQAEN